MWKTQHVEIRVNQNSGPEMLFPKVSTQQLGFDGFCWRFPRGETSTHPWKSLGLSSLCYVWLDLGPHPICPEMLIEWRNPAFPLAQQQKKFPQKSRFLGGGGTRHLIQVLQATHRGRQREFGRIIPTCHHGLMDSKNHVHVQKVSHLPG